MRKTKMLTLLICGLVLAGCGNNNNNAGSAEPGLAGQETAAPATAAPVTSVPDNAQPDSTVPSTAAPTASPATEQSPEVSGTKQDYLAKLDDVEAGLKDLQSLKDEGTTASMTDAANQEYERWDKALNEIYNELKLQLPESEMTELKQKQLDWIAYRDETAKKASLKFEGGTMESLEYVSVLGSVTKDRCYELVKVYMK